MATNAHPAKGSLRSEMAVSIRGEGSATLELDVYDVVGSGHWLFGGGVSAQTVRDSLKANPQAQAIKVRINSLGGEVNDGIAIYNLLVAHPARVEVSIDGIAASIASIVAMAGDTIGIAENAMMMIHDPASGLMGTAAQLRSRANVLDKIGDNLAATYAARSGQPIADVLAAMKAETWMTATEAKALGYATDITPAKAMAASAYAASDLDRFQNVPASLRVIAAAAPPQQSTAQTNAGQSPTQEPSMKLSPVILTALALGADATESDVAQAIESAKANADKAVATFRAEIASAEARAVALEAAIGKTGEEAIGYVAGLKAKAEAHDRLAAEMAEIRAAAVKTERDSLIASALSTDNASDANPHAGKLTPHMKAWAEAQSVDALKAYLDAAPRLIPVAIDAPATKQTDGLPAGKTFAQLSTMEKHALKESNPDLYASLRASAENP